ncbi:MAG: universal stress protein [Desulfobacterales bacterium]|nr:universal stress protein [Desulfobacterales bacterium]
MIPKPKRILFASDLSTDMKEVFEHAASYAAYAGAEIIVLHVMEEASKSSEKLVRVAFGESLYRNLKNEQKTGARNLLTGKNVDALRIRQAIAGFFAEEEQEPAPMEEGSPIEKILVTESQSIASEITQTAVEENCDVIVMGCKQQGIIAEAVGVVRKVLKRTSTPVFLVPLGKR